MFSILIIVTHNGQLSTSVASFESVGFANEALRCIGAYEIEVQGQQEQRFFPRVLAIPLFS